MKQIVDKLNKIAKKIDEISYIDVLNKKLNVMDSTAISLCMEENIPLLVFNINKKGNLFIQSYIVANEGLYRKIYITY